MMDGTSGGPSGGKAQWPDEPGRPPRLQDEDKEREHEFEFDLLRRHEEKFDPQRWLQGMSQKRQMPQRTLEAIDPGPAILKKDDGPAVFLGSAKPQVRVYTSDNPQPHSSLGFVGSVVAVEAKEDWTPGTLAVRFDPKQLGPVARDSLRLFYWNSKRDRFEMVHGSQPSTEGDYVFGRIAMPGRYAIIGVNADPLVLPAVRLVCDLGALGAALPEVGRKLIDPICQVILCAPELRQALRDPRVVEQLLGEGAEYGFFPPPGPEPVPPGGDICEQCLGTGGMRLPECEIVLPPGGPSCADFWDSVGPKDLSGCIKEVHVDPTNSDRLYCAAANGGIWVLDQVSTYPGTSWRPLTDHLDILRMVAVAVAPSDGNVIYAASPHVGLLRSDDRGANWLLLAATSGWYVYRILIHPADANTLYAATSGGFWASTDGGATWTQQRSGNVHDAAFDPLDSSIIYLGVPGEGVLKSVTAGYGPWAVVLPWSAATSPAGLNVRIALGYRHAGGALQMDADRTVVAKLGLEIFVNQRGGRDTGAGWVSKGSRGDSSQLWWDNVLAVDPFDPAVILTGEQSLHRSADGGDHWSTVASYYAPHEDQQSVAFDRNNQGVVYLSNDGGVYRSTDGGQTWYVAPIVVADEIAARRSLVKNLVTAEFYRVGVQFNAAVGNLYHSGIIAATYLSSGRWSGIEGHAWEFANVHADPKRPGRFYVFHGGLARRRFPGTGSDDFINIAEFRPYAAVGAIAVDVRPGSNVILVCAHDDSAAGAGYRLMMTTEGDREPTRQPDGTITNQPTWPAAIDNGGDPLVSVALAPSEPAKAYAISQAGKAFRQDDIDAGGAWSQPGELPLGDVRQLAVNSQNSDRLYAITGYNVFRSIDGGASWSHVGAGSVPLSEFNSLVADPHSGTRLYLGADIGVFVSDDEGDTWSPFDVGLPNAEVFQILISGNFLYAVTHGRGLWRRGLC